MSIQKPASDLELLLYVAEDPIRLLGGKSFPLFECFELGYACGLPAGAVFGWLPKSGFEEFVRARFPAAERWLQHLSTTGYIRFLGPDDASAFDLHVALRRDYFAAHPPEPIEPCGSNGWGLDQIAGSCSPTPADVPHRNFGLDGLPRRIAER
jgi:hypothetical protein